jgi:hypothetical protein
MIKGTVSQQRQDAHAGGGGDYFFNLHTGPVLVQLWHCGDDRSPAQY